MLYLRRPKPIEFSFVASLAKAKRVKIAKGRNCTELRRRLKYSFHWFWLGLLAKKLSLNALPSRTAAGDASCDQRRTEERPSE
jgi:hypothetical protein